MPDYTEVLSEISDALAAISSAPSYIWVSPVSILASVGLGWMLSEIPIRRKEKTLQKEREARNQLIFQLLREELSHRWQGQILPYLRDLEQKEPIEALIHLARMEINGIMYQPQEAGSGRCLEFWRWSA